MNQKLTVIIVGEKEEIKEFIAMLKEQKIGYRFPKEETEEVSERERRKTYYREAEGRVFLLTYEQLRIILSTLFSTVVVELTKEAIKAIIKWLRERRKKGLKRPKLKIIVEGNILDLSQKDMKVLMKMLEEVSKEKSSS